MRIGARGASRRVRVVVATLGPPLPADRGARVRDFELVRRLAARHEVILAPVVDPRVDAAALDAIEPVPARIVPIRSRTSMASAAARVPMLAAGMPAAAGVSGSW